MSDWLDFLGSDSDEAVTRNRQRFAAASDAAELAADRLESRAEKRKKRTSAWWYAGVALAAVAVGFIAYAIYAELAYLA
ncbi:hypothetical protein [Lentzea sp. E54]|uniref:hypothetical protein n=1 Tax=Lentzea xerophila TaxID=3435883 RepID=UPI003DA680AE